MENSIILEENYISYQKFDRSLIILRSQLIQIQKEIDSIPPDVQTFTINSINQQIKHVVYKIKEKFKTFSDDLTSSTALVRTQDQVTCLNQIALTFVQQVQKLHDRELTNQGIRKQAIHHILAMNNIYYNEEIDEEKVVQHLVHDDLQYIKYELQNSKVIQQQTQICRDLSQEILDATITTISLQIQQGEFLNLCNKKLEQSLKNIKESEENHEKALKANKLKKQLIKISIIVIIIIILLMGLCSLVLKST
uniref:SNARE n=1 Tax=Spironucleus salmonicida TaxID=348837 RepID=V6LB60_9EUKA|eukprot:EST41660.1 Hypothetical protein SS50377_18747 [Spironucleus salmonicida]